ncbi:MAG: hypothetical protein HRT46_12315 [Deltaproteobacteria bacterium]|nr:hypothetical protein [Deltaproteobacteria bacterium]
MCGTQLALLPPDHVDGVEPGAVYGHRSAWAGYVNPDPTGRRVIRPYIPGAAESLSEFGGEDIITGDR